MLGHYSWRHCLNMRLHPSLWRSLPLLPYRIDLFLVHLHPHPLHIFWKASIGEGSASWVWCLGAQELLGWPHQRRSSVLSVSERSTPHIWQLWALAPVSLRSQSSWVAACSWPASPKCCCRLSNPPESQPAGRVSVGSGEKSPAPTSLWRSQRRKAIRRRNKRGRRRFEGSWAVAVCRSPPDLQCQTVQECTAPLQSSLSRHSYQRQLGRIQRETYWLCRRWADRSSPQRHHPLPHTL